MKGVVRILTVGACTALAMTWATPASAQMEGLVAVSERTIEQERVELNDYGQRVALAWPLGIALLSLVDSAMAFCEVTPLSPLSSDDTVVCDSSPRDDSDGFSAPLGVDRLDVLVTDELRHARPYRRHLGPRLSYIDLNGAFVEGGKEIILEAE